MGGSAQIVVRRPRAWMGYYADPSKYCLALLPAHYDWNHKTPTRNPQLPQAAWSVSGATHRLASQLLPTASPFWCQRPRASYCRHLLRLRDVLHAQRLRQPPRRDWRALRLRDHARGDDEFRHRFFTRRLIFASRFRRRLVRFPRPRLRRSSRRSRFWRWLRRGRRRVRLMHAFIPTAATPNTTIHLIRHHRESVDTCYLSGQVMANVGRIGSQGKNLWHKISGLKIDR